MMNLTIFLSVRSILSSWTVIVMKCSTKIDYKFINGLFCFCLFFTVRNGVEVKSVQASVGKKSVTGMKEISYTNESMIGNGSFGVVYKATLVEENEVVAIKRVLQDRRFKNRELSIMVSLEHCNIVRLKYYFYTYKNVSFVLKSS